MKLRYSAAMLMLVALVLAAPGLAQEHTAATANAQTDVQANVGITPDSPFYGLKTAFERTRSALTFGAAAKADLNMQYAEKRLAEAQAMIEANNTQAAQRAAQGFERASNAAAEATMRVRSDGSQERAATGLEQATQARAQLQANMARAAEIHADILARQETRMDEEQHAQIQSVFENISSAAMRADERIEEKRAQSKQRYQTIGNVSAQQADEFAANISAQTGLDAQLQAHQNALVGLNTALEAASGANEQARAALTQRINTLNTSTTAGVGVDVAIGAGEQPSQEQREEANSDEQANATADAQINGSAQTNGARAETNVRAGAQI